MVHQRTHGAGEKPVTKLGVRVHGPRLVLGDVARPAADTDVELVLNKKGIGDFHPNIILTRLYFRGNV